MVLYFKAFRWEGELQRNEPLKFRAAEWHDLHKLPKNLTGTIKKVLKDSKEGILFTEKKTTTQIKRGYLFRQPLKNLIILQNPN